MYQLTKTQNVEKSFGEQNIPFNNPNFTGSKKAKFLEVSSLNYDYLPMNLESPKMFWIDLIRPPPEDLTIDSIIKLHINSNKLLSNYNINNSIFHIDDIVGSRIVLIPYKGDALFSKSHKSSDYYRSWGYDMNKNNMSSNMNTTKYGYGSSISSLEYYPDIPTFEEITRDAMQLTQNYYRGSKYIPGWNC